MSAMGTTPTTGPASGRPRDPGLDARVLDAAFSVYARRGWAGFTSEEVARQAGVGKSSLYLRWPTKLAVLLDSIRLRERDNVVADTGDLRHDLLAFARQTFDRLNGEDGAVTLRLIVESRFYDDLRDGLSSAAHIEQIHAIRAIVRRAIKRGDLGFQRAGCLHVARTEAKMLCAVLRGSEAATPEAVNCGYRPVLNQADHTRIA